MYRFENIVGNQQIIKNLKSAMKNKMISHAYILKGAYGSGKMLMAETFASAMQCEQGIGNICGVCTSCKTMLSNNNPDVFYVTAKNGKAIGADDIREQVVNEVEIRPYQHRYKVFIVENADTMTVAAQNVILKTLEEPPSYGVFLLLAENTDAFLQTIISRCVMLKMAQLSPKQVEDYLIDILSKDNAEAEFFAKYSAGSIGRAIKLSEDQGFRQMREDITEKIYTIYDTDLIKVMLWSKDIEKYKENIFDCLDIIYLWFRDVFVAKKLNSTNHVIQKDKEDKIISQAKIIEFKQLENSLKAVWEAKRQLEQNGNFQLTMEIMFMNIKGV